MKIYKQDKLVSDTIDFLTSKPIRITLKHNKNCTEKQKRKIRKVFNEIQPALLKKIIEEFRCFPYKLI